MKTWKVTGAHRHTGKPKSIEVVAPTREEAEEAASVHANVLAEKTEEQTVAVVPNYTWMLITAAIFVVLALSPFLIFLSRLGNMFSGREYRGPEPTTLEVVLTAFCAAALFAIRDIARNSFKRSA